MLYQSLGDGAAFAFDARHAESEQLVAVVGGGRGCVLQAEAPVAGVWIPLRGRLQLGAGRADTVLSCGELRISECESGGQAIGRGNAIWFALLGGQRAWRNALVEQMDLPTPEPLLLPACYAAEAALRRCAITLARAAAANNRTDGAAIPLFEKILTLQAKLHVVIDRCPGRTYAHRRQVFLRLQRVRNYMAANCHLDLDNDVLARMASFSPWHFIRAFRAAYQETPHAYLINHRLLRARHLVRTSPLAISEIAMVSGFEDRCAFSRLFRERFGISARALRQQSVTTTGISMHVVRAISATQANSQVQHLEARVS
jgi:AraC family transcriptional regulator